MFEIQENEDRDFKLMFLLKKLCLNASLNALFHIFQWQDIDFFLLQTDLEIIFLSIHNIDF